MADNSSSINVAANPIYISQTKHIDVADHYNREHRIRKSIMLSYVTSNDDTADVMPEELNSVANHGHTQRLVLSE